VVAALPLIFQGSAYWLGLVALGLCYSVTFLTFTLVTGEGGMLWLSQIIFAGAGALAAAQFVTVWHVPVLLALVLGGLVAAVIGAIIGLLTIRLGDLYVALVTLTFGLLAETLVFSRSRFSQGGVGVFLNRPSFVNGDLAFAYLALVVFLVFAVLTMNLRRSTSGLALRAVRDSEPAARTLGLSVLQVKVIVGALAAFVAAVGGGFLALDARVAQPQFFATFAGLVWLAVVVTMGVRSITAAALAGLAFALLPGVFQTYVPSQWGEVPALLFGLGAIMVVRHPEGVVLYNGRQLRLAWSRIVSPTKREEPGALPAGGGVQLGKSDPSRIQPQVAPDGPGAEAGARR
jgi:branched-chain amino acid transport system permease protein